MADRTGPGASVDPARENAMQRALAGLLCTIAVVAGAEAQEAAGQGGLPELDLEPAVTVSGLSSGAFFAHQFHLAFSDIVEGAAILAGGPYACASNVPSALWAHPTPEVATAVAVCTHAARDAFGGFGLFLPSAPDADDSEEAIEEARRDGEIHDPAAVGDDRVYLFHGAEDPIVPDGSMEAVEDVYRSLGVEGDRLHVDRRRDAAHGFPVEEVGESAFGSPECDETGRPYLIDCDFDAAEALLRHLLDGLDPPVEPVRDHLKRFDQTPFFDAKDESLSLAAEGFVYVPEACVAGETCRLHVAFHGCDQYASVVGDDFVWDAGYNGWAEANRIVVLYPQTTPWSRALDPTGLTGNPQGCWDWWGYSGREYATRDAPQMEAVRHMVEALGAGR